LKFTKKNINLTAIIKKFRQNINLMSIEFKISNQYLRSNQKKGFVSFISGVSIVGLVLGVITLITVPLCNYEQSLKCQLLSTWKFFLKNVPIQ
jgi:hypothetical protein